jgi:hypothetical protein
MTKEDAMMDERHSDVADVDRPEPEEALSGTAARSPDHEPTDQDDREVPLDDPEEHDGPVDDAAGEPVAGDGQVPPDVVGA